MAEQFPLLNEQKSSDDTVSSSLPGLFRGEKMFSNSNNAPAADSDGAADSSSTAVTLSPASTTASYPAQGYGQAPTYGQGQVPTSQYPQQQHYVTNPGPGQQEPDVLPMPKVPNTTVPLVLSAISALFCGFLCGAAGIVFSWKARMQSIKRRYEEANHSVCVAWIFFALACLTGFVIWGAVSACVAFFVQLANKH